MREDIQQALVIDGSSTMAERTIDITTTGRCIGQPRRIEICFSRSGDQIYITGVPTRRTRDWLANLAAVPTFTFHLKNAVTADLPAVATVVTDPDERRRVLAQIVEDFNARRTPDSPFPYGVLDEWVELSPLVSVDFVDAD